MIIVFIINSSYILRRPQNFAKSHPYIASQKQNFVDFSEYVNFNSTNKSIVNNVTKLPNYTVVWVVGVQN